MTRTLKPLPQRFCAMAMGTPMVSTTIGAEGLPIRDGEQLMIADSPDAQSAAIVMLLRDRGCAGRFAASAQAFVQKSCSWSVIADQFSAQFTV